MEVEVSFRTITDPWGPVWVCCVVWTVNGAATKLYGYCLLENAASHWLALTEAIREVQIELEG